MTDTAAELQAKGIAQAHEHAEKVRPGWTNDAVALVAQYAAKVEAPFLIEDAKAWAYEHGLDKPPSDSSWGAVPRRAARDGWIHNTGHMAKTRSPGGHKDEKVLWKVGSAGEKLTSSPHSRSEVLKMAKFMREWADQLRAEGREARARAFGDQA